MPRFSSLLPAQRYAIIAAIIILLWVLSGVVWRAIVSDAEEAVGEKAAPLAGKIELMASNAVSKQRYAEIYGVTKASRDVSLAAQTQGEVVAIIAREGKPITRGAPIVRIDMQDRKTRLAAAQALLLQRQQEFAGAKRLKEKGYESDVAYARTKAELQDVKATIAQLKLDIGHTTIRAPFDGVLEAVNVEMGDFAGVGVFGVEGSIARVIDIDPLLAVGEVTQSDRAFIDDGKPVNVRFENGTEIEGTISYLAKAANEQSRSFPFEVSLNNKDASIASGLSATIRLPLQSVDAHLVPSSLLSLNDAGELRVKVLDDEQRVTSYIVDIIEESEQGLWLGGLPQQVRFISAGQSFVKDGDVVDDASIVGGDDEPSD